MTGYIFSFFTSSAPPFIESLSFVQLYRNDDIDDGNVVSTVDGLSERTQQGIFGNIFKIFIYECWIYENAGNCSLLKEVLNEK